MAIAKSKIEVQLREVFLKNRPQALYDISKKGTVPVLELNNGIVIDESLDIMHWAIKKSFPKLLIFKKQQQDEIIKHNDFYFKPWLDKYKYHVRYPEDHVESYREKCKQTLLSYENNLSTSSFLIDNSIQLVDMAVFPFVRQFANVDRSWFAENFPNTERWLEEWIQSDIFKRVMIKFEQWKLDDEPQKILF